MSAVALQRSLVMDDETDIGVIAKVALEQVGGFTVAVCESGSAAIDRAIDFVPDLVLLDVMMPHMDGPSTLAAMRRIPQLDEIPVVFLTAKAQESEVSRFKTLGAVDVITKPFDPMRLAERLRLIWDRTCGDG